MNEATKTYLLQWKEKAEADYLTIIRLTEPDIYRH